VTGAFKKLDYPGSTDTYVYSISNKGVVAGAWTDSSGVDHGFVYNHGIFSTVDATGAASTAVWGINSHGNIVGIEYDASSDYHGFYGGTGLSDVRLKEDIVPLERLSNRLGLYRFRYKWSSQQYVGVMAQEVAETNPEAVVSGSDGYLRVDYGRLGLRMMTWDEWVAKRQTH